MCRSLLVPKSLWCLNCDSFQDLPGEYSVTLTINNLQKEDVGHENELVITNDEGSTTYKFILEIGSKPPSGNFFKVQPEVSKDFAAFFWLMLEQLIQFLYNNLRIKYFNRVSKEWLSFLEVGLILHFVILVHSLNDGFEASNLCSMDLKANAWHDKACNLNCKAVVFLSVFFVVFNCLNRLSRMLV